MATIARLAVARSVRSSTRSAAVSKARPFSSEPSIRQTAELKDIKTHTGQSFQEKDYRVARFVGKEKEVNTRFAIDLIAEAAPIAVKGRNTFCDGGDGPLGHPRVFINLDQPGNHSCGYCGLRFYQDGSHGHH